MLPSDVIRPPYGRYSYSARRPRASPKREVTFFIASCIAVEMLFLLRPVRFPARHGQDARGLRFRGVPDVTAHNLRRFPGQVALRHLQVVTVEVARVEARCPSNRHFFLESPAHGVVGAFHGCPSVFAFKFHGPVFRVVGDFPDARGCFYQRLVAVGIVLRDEGRSAIFYHSVVLVDFIAFIVRRVAEFEGFLPVADVVVLMVIRSSTTPGSIFIYTF